MRALRIMVLAVAAVMAVPALAQPPTDEAVMVRAADVVINDSTTYAAADAAMIGALAPADAAAMPDRARPARSSAPATDMNMISSSAFAGGAAGRDYRQHEDPGRLVG